MTAYRRGVYVEKKTADALRNDGYYVIESRGSHGVADLVALKARQALMIQVKSGQAALKHAEWNALLDAARAAGATPVVATWPARGRLSLTEITGPHKRGSRYWPGRELTIDLVDLLVTGGQPA